MGRLFPVEILKEGYSLLKSRSGLILIAINFLFFLLIGFVTLVAAILILGPAAMLLREPEIMSGILVFFLSLIFIEIVILFVIFEQFVILACLARHFQKQQPLFSIKAFQDDMPRFMLYLKSCMYALVKICVGLLLFVVPGVQAFFRYLLVGAIAIFEFDENKTSEQILEKSEQLTKGKLVAFASLFFAFFLILLGVDALLGRVVMQLIVGPVISTYFTICVVLYYKKLLQST